MHSKYPICLLNNTLQKVNNIHVSSIASTTCKKYLLFSVNGRVGLAILHFRRETGRTDRQMCPELEEREKNGRSIIVLTLSVSRSGAAAKKGTRARGESRTKQDYFCQVDK